MLRTTLLQYSIGPFGVALISLITLPALTWLYNEEVVASYTLFFIVLNLSTIFLSLGFDQSLVRNYFSYVKSDLFLLTIFPGLILLSCILLVTYFINVDISPLLIGSSGLTKEIILGITFAFFSRFLSLIIRMENKPLLFSFSQILPKILLLAFLFLAYIEIIYPTISNLFFAIIIGMGLTLFIQLVSCSNILINVSFSSFTPYDLFTNFKYAFPLLISSCAYYVLTISDRYFIKELLTLEDLAHYSVAAHFAGVVFIIQSVFSTIWPSFIYKCYEKAEDKNLHKEVISNVSKLLLSIITFIWVCTGAGAFLVELFLPPNYTLVTDILPVLIAIPLISLITEVTSVGINLKKKTYNHTIITILTLVVNLVGNVILIPKYGVIGAAYSTLFSYLLCFFLKTEVSVRMGFTIDRFSAYSTLLFLSAITVILSSIDVEQYINITVWLFLFLMFILVNIKNLETTKEVIKGIKKGGSFV